MNAAAMHCCTKRMLGTKRPGDQQNQVPRGRGFWPVVSIPSRDARTAIFGVRASGWNEHSGRSMGSDKSKGEGARGRVQARAQGKHKSDRPDPSKQRLETKIHCRLCGEEGHWQADRPNADVDMVPADKRS